MYTINTAKGAFSGSLLEVCKWQAAMQGSWATMSVSVDGGPMGVGVGVDDIDFDAEDLAATIRAVRARIEEEETD